MGNTSYLSDTAPGSDAIRIAISRNTYEKQVSNIDYSFESNKSSGKELISDSSRLNNKTYYYPSKVSLINDHKRSVGAPITKSNQFLRDLMAIATDTSLHGLDKDAIKQKKLNEMPLFCTGQFPDASGFTRNECIGNNNLLAFDLDGTDITDKQIERLFLGCELLIYTTASNDPSADLRRIRIVVVCSRSMSIAEHRRIMDLYSKELMALSANHGLDASKLTPWSKFYFPHKESIKNHIKRRKHALDIDAVLARMPKEPQVIAPSSDDIELHYPTIQVATKSSVLGKCQALIGQMSKGNRSGLAVKIAGIMGKANLHPSEKQHIYGQMQSHGVDPSALKQVRKYAKMIVLY